MSTPVFSSLPAKPVGFLAAPSGNKSVMRLVLLIIICTLAVFGLVALGLIAYIAFFKPEIVQAVGVALGFTGGPLVFLGGKALKYKAVQRAAETVSGIAPKAMPAARAALPGVLGKVSGMFDGSPPAATEVPVADIEDVAPGDEDRDDATGADPDAPELAPVAASVPLIPTQCVDLILDFEGIDQPSKVPPGNSGVSIGRGYDLGYETTFRFDWADVLPAATIALLATALGKRGAAARKVAADFKAIKITRAQADAVFFSHTLPQEVAKTRKAFPGYGDAPEVVKGVLVSLVYNRGPSMVGASRKEMRLIADAVRAGRWADIPQFLRAMKRLWPDVPGLQRRREAEAKMIERGVLVA